MAPTDRRATPERIADTALGAFGTRGYEATSLDDLARDLGIRKQTILYWYPSKEALLTSVIDRTAAEVMARLERAVAASKPGFGRIEAIVVAMSRLVARHPAMLGFVREVSRLGPPASTRLTSAIARWSTGPRATWRPRWMPAACAATTRGCCCWPPTRWSPGWRPR
jgi:AcrR family transcriptional regulator